MTTKTKNTMTHLIVVAVLMLASTGFSGEMTAEKNMQTKTEIATFASGCFWCTESDFEQVPGVIDVVSGYIGGSVKKPTYSQVSAGGTGHAEAVQVTYDPKKVSYQQLLDFYWVHADPTVKDRQFCDQGTQYRTAIFYHNADQKKLALNSKEKVAGLLKVDIYTQIAEADQFYPAEDYHQDYYKKNPIRYKYYRFNCGRDQRLEQLWKKLGGDEGSLK